uniref:Cyanobacterial aminoacyl-tRNA synthetase CAAD domain-containing protein n=1 Tax=Leersia perrieri TaxID=77586 RepID=A0A0D9XLW9_9ORYZ
MIQAIQRPTPSYQFPALNVWYPSHPSPLIYPHRRPQIPTVHRRKHRSILFVWIDRRHRSIGYCTWSKLASTDSSMAPTVATTTPAVATTAAAATTAEVKPAKRSIGLGLPALPPLPGLASHAQPRVASFCKRLARNVVAMAAGEAPAAPIAANAEITEFIDALKQEWDRIEDKYAVTTLAVAASLGMWSAGGVVSAIDRLPVIPGLMEAVGIGYSGWFAYRNLLFKPDREAFFAKVREVYEDIISG